MHKLAHCGQPLIDVSWSWKHMSLKMGSYHWMDDMMDIPNIQVLQHDQLTKVHVTIFMKVLRP
jgi:hypothetical protein